MMRALVRYIAWRAAIVLTAIVCIAFTVGLVVGILV